MLVCILEKKYKNINIQKKTYNLQLFRLVRRIRLVKLVDICLKVFKKKEKTESKINTGVDW